MYRNKFRRQLSCNVLEMYVRGEFRNVYGWEEGDASQRG
jgi:hypothetical protein